MVHEIDYKTVVFFIFVLLLKGEVKFRLYPSRRINKKNRRKRERERREKKGIIVNDDVFMVM